jgi:hypothetical protein
MAAGLIIALQAPMRGIGDISRSFGIDESLPLTASSVPLMHSEGLLASVQMPSSRTLANSRLLEVTYSLGKPADPDRIAADLLITSSLLIMITEVSDSSPFVVTRSIHSAVELTDWHALGGSVFSPDPSQSFVRFGSLSESRCSYEFDSIQ